MKKINPAAIGTFLVGAVVLMVIAIVLFGSADLFDRKEKFIAYFNDSVNGLEIGSPVKFKGVKIGEVSEIRIRTPNQDRDSDAVPVIMEVNLTQLDKLGVQEVDLGNDEIYRAQIEQGLVAMLELESYLTGRLFVELDYVPEPPGFVVPVQEQVLPGIPEKEIPTVSTGISQVFESVEEVAAKLAEIDYEGLAYQIQRVLENTDKLLTQVEAGKINDNLVAASTSLKELLGDRNLKEAIANLNSTLAHLDALIVRVDDNVEPLVGEIVATARSIQNTLDQAGQTLATLDAALGRDSPTRSRVEDAMAEIEGAARSVRELAAFLERNPNALLTGRAAP